MEEDMIGYVHIYVDGKEVRNWRFFDTEDRLPKPGQEFPLCGDKWDVRYLVESMEMREKIEGAPDSCILHCKDLSKELYGPWRRQTFMGSFHELDPTIMKMYPEYKQGDYEHE